MRILFIILVACVQGFGQNTVSYPLGEISHFDSLLQYNQIIWHLTEHDEQLNSNTLNFLSSQYLRGWHKEISTSEVKGQTNETTRWIFNLKDSCSVYEQMIYGWGGVFGYINGVRTRTIGEFEAALDSKLKE